MPKITADEKRWRAESDAEILIKNQEILSDKTRLANAKKILLERARASNKALSAANKKARR